MAFIPSGMPSAGNPLQFRTTAAAPTFQGRAPRATGQDTVKFSGNDQPETADKPGILQRLKTGTLQALKSGLNPGTLLVDTIWSSVFVGISAVITAGPGGVVTLPFIPIAVATGAVVRGLFGFIKGFSQTEPTEKA